MQILKLVDTEGKPLGLISWFPVHCTSLNNTNRLISGDNKGYASYLMEKEMNPESLPGKVGACSSRRASCSHALMLMLCSLSLSRFRVALSLRLSTQTRETCLPTRKVLAASTRDSRATSRRAPVAVR